MIERGEEKMNEERINSGRRREEDEQRVKV